MRILLQRVSSGRVRVNGEITGEISSGILALVGFGKNDTEANLAPLLEKLLQLRIFPDERGRFDKSLLDMQGGLLLVPQFTLYGDTSKGRRPDFFDALEPDAAKKLFSALVAFAKSQIGSAGRVACGVFGAHMQVELVNDGPVTLMLEA